MNTALTRIPVGVVVERRKSDSPWIEFTWRPVAVLPGQPDTPVWSVLSENGGATQFYAGPAEISLYRTETANYHDNLAADAELWVVLRATDRDPPYELFAVTADPAEGEAFTEPGVDLVDKVPMPESVFTVVERFVAEHHTERPRIKQSRAERDALRRKFEKGVTDDE
jgi:hypothetical protein